MLLAVSWTDMASRVVMAIKLLQCMEDITAILHQPAPSSKPAQPTELKMHKRHRPIVAWCLSGRVGSPWTLHSTRSHSTPPRHAHRHAPLSWARDAADEIGWTGDEHDQ